MRSKVKCLHVITGLAAGGAERALYNVLNGGLATRFESRVVSLSDEGTFGKKLQEIGVPVSCLGLRRGEIPSIGTVIALRRLVQEFCPDVVQGWMYHGNLAASLAKSVAPGRPMLAWNIRHCLYSLSSEKPMTRQIIRVSRLISKWPDVVLYNSALSREQHEALGFSGQFGRVIPNGFDLNHSELTHEMAETERNNLGIPRTSLVIGHVARFHPMKDHVGFVQSAVAVAAKMKDVHFMLCGADVEPSNDTLVGLVPPAMRSQFHWLGERDSAADLMCAMDVLCLSSWSEAFPNVLGEAMARGIPCVATDVGDSAIIVGDTGLIVPARDVGALAGALVRFLKLSDDERNALGEAARIRVAQNYSIGTIVDQYADVYERLATNARIVN